MIVTTSFLSREEVERLGLRAHPTALVSRHASFYGASRVSIGRNSRIDDFCVLSAGDGGIEIGSFVHISVGCTLTGKAKIKMSDFSGLSARVTIYSSSDDYSGEYMTNPTVDARYTNVAHLPVTLGEHVIVGAGSVLLPGVTLHEGAAIGALSFVKHDAPAWTISAGNPARVRRQRSRALLTIAARMNDA